MPFKFTVSADDETTASSLAQYIGGKSIRGVSVSGVVGYGKGASHGTLVRKYSVDHIFKNYVDWFDYLEWLKYVRSDVKESAPTARMTHSYNVSSSDSGGPGFHKTRYSGRITLKVRDSKKEGVEVFDQLMLRILERLKIDYAVEKFGFETGGN